jgi:hypothetical protein
LAVGKILIILGALLSILGTYVFALFLFWTGVVGSGLGFAMNLPDIIVIDPSSLGADAITFYIMLVIFIIWLVSGVLQLVGLKVKIVGIIFSLFPLGIGIMFMLLLYTEVLGPMSALFTLFTIGEHFGDFFPILVQLGDLGLGAYFLLAGGALGLVGSIMPRE